MIIQAEQLKALGQEIPYKWRKGNGGLEYPYINARDVMDLLDAVVGPANWQRDYKEVGGRVYCGVAIRVEGEWVWKWDCGAESHIEAQKGESSDAFKRAAVSWGVGRFLYQIKSKSQNYPSSKTIPSKSQATQIAREKSSPHSPVEPPAKSMSRNEGKSTTKKNEPVTSRDWAEIKELREAIAMDSTQLEQTIQKRYGKVWKDLKSNDIKDLKTFLKNTDQVVTV